jgi:HrpA-like RNA helicase
VPLAFKFADLPIKEQRDAILEALQRSQVLIVAGETGSGKSTQLPQYCLEAGRGIAGVIAHTQPRRLAARAARIAAELGQPVCKDRCRCKAAGTAACRTFASGWRNFVCPCTRKN